MDRDQNGRELALFESRAIMQYLVNCYAPGHVIYSADPLTKARVDQLLFWDASAYGYTRRKYVVSSRLNSGYIVNLH